MDIDWDLEQRSDEWHRRRLGKVKSSHGDRIITPTGSPARKDRVRKYVSALTYELMTGDSAERDLSNIKAVRDGIRREPLARMLFEKQTGLPVRPCGLVTTTNGKVCCSPDGWISDSIGLEIKCPEGATLVDYLLNRDVFLETYRPQLQLQMWVCGWASVHFYAYHPLCPAFHAIVERDPEYQTTLSQLLVNFGRDLDRAVGIASRLAPFVRPEKPTWDDEPEDEQEEAA